MNVNHLRSFAQTVLDNDANKPQGASALVALAQRGVEIMITQAMQRTLGAYEIEAAFRRDGVPPCRC